MRRGLTRYALELASPQVVKSPIPTVQNEGFQWNLLFARGTSTPPRHTRDADASGYPEVLHTVHGL